MNYKTTYIVVVGDKDTFESEMSRLSGDGFTWCGNMTSNVIEGDIMYSQLMYKIEPIN